MASELIEPRLDVPVHGGSDAALAFVLQWEVDPLGSSAADVTWGSLSMLVGREPVWGSSSSGIRWSWVELLEFLTDVWWALHAEEGFPEGLGPGDPVVRLRHFADVVRLASDAGLDVAALDADPDRVQEFTEAHDLASALNGVALPPIWIAREGVSCWICSSSATRSVDFEEVHATLELLAEAIAERLRRYASDERSQIALERWKTRDDLDLDEFVSLATGLDEERIHGLEREEGALFWEVDQDGRRFEPTEVLAIARMAATASAFDLTKVLDLVRSELHRATRELDRLSSRVTESLHGRTALKPFKAGYVLATALRRELGLADDERVEPEQLLDEWGVPVRRMVLEASALDAIACWGPRHGPLIILNRQGTHASTRAGSRATLAHEIAHLLSDRHQWLPLAEVAGGRVTDQLEQRARAFAAELLLPSAEAARRLTSDNRTPSKAIRAVAKDFGVSLEIVSWQARNSGQWFGDDVWRYLRKLVSQPSAF